MKFQLLSTFRHIYSSDQVISVTVPTQTGEITILDEHIPIISALRPGILHVQTSDNQTLEYAVGGGVLHMDGKELSIIADMVEGSEGEKVDKEEIKRRKEAIEKKMESYGKGETAMEMKDYIALEYEYMKESAKETIANA